MKAVNIKWDTDDDKDLLENLPQEVTIPPELAEAYNYDPFSGIEDINDWLTETSGFCHYGFELEE